ncbi:hypothetical protein CYMTET_54091, partial [Cymbomonas tetramitiformis]
MVDSVGDSIGEAVGEAEDETRDEMLLGKVANASVSAYEALPNWTSEATFTLPLLTEVTLTAVELTPALLAICCWKLEVKEALKVELEKLEIANDGKEVIDVTELVELLPVGEEEVGVKDGDTEGECVGVFVGETVRNALGESVGNGVGDAESEEVGNVVGEVIGSTVGDVVGGTVGKDVG